MSADGIAPEHLGEESFAPRSNHIAERNTGAAYVCLKKKRRPGGNPLRRSGR